MNKIALIHTSFVSVDHLNGLFRELVPDAKIVNIVDDSLLVEVMANGGLTRGVTQRVCCYAQQAERLGVDLIFNQCSSVGEAIDVARNLVHVPILKVDEPMAEKAIRLGKSIAVIATVASTVEPSVRLVERTAERLGKTVHVTPVLVDGALEVLMAKGDKEAHNQMVLERIEQVQHEHDVVVLAQGSMVVLLPLLQDIRIPVLSSPRLGVERARDLLVAAAG